MQKLVEYTPKLGRALKHLVDNPPGIDLSGDPSPHGKTQSILGSHTSVSYANNQTTSSSGPVLCKITGGTAETGFSVWLYPDINKKDAQGTGILFAVELSANSSISTGSWVLGYPCALEITGGSEK